MEHLHNDSSQLAPLWKRRFHFWLMNFLVLSALATTIPLKPVIVTAAFVTGQPFSLDGCDGAHGAQNAACNQARSKAALWIGMAAGLNALLGMICGPVCGAWGDMYGRRRLLTCTMLLFFVMNLALFLTSIAPGFVWFYFLFEALLGVCPYQTVIFAVIADERLPSERAAAFGAFQGVLGGSVIIGPVASILLTIKCGCVLAVLGAAIAVALAVLYPETSPGARNVLSLMEGEEAHGLPSRRRSWLGVSTREMAHLPETPHGSVLRPDAVLRILCSSVVLRRLSLCVLVTSIPIAVLQSCYMLFLQSQLQVPREQATWYLVSTASSGLFVAIFILRFFVKSLGLRWTLLVGLVFQFSCNVFFASSSFVSILTARVLVLLGSMAAGFAMMNFPMIAAMKANAVSAEMQGRIQGAISSLQYSAMAIGPLVGGAVLSFFSQSHPGLGLARPFYGAPFAICALVAPVAIAAAYSLPDSAENAAEPEQQDRELKVGESGVQDVHQGA